MWAGLRRHAAALKPRQHKQAQTACLLPAPISAALPFVKPSWRIWRHLSSGAGSDQTEPLAPESSPPPEYSSPGHALLAFLSTSPEPLSLSIWARLLPACLALHAVGGVSARHAAEVARHCRAACSAAEHPHPDDLAHVALACLAARAQPRWPSPPFNGALQTLASALQQLPPHTLRPHTACQLLAALHLYSVQEPGLYTVAVQCLALSDPSAPLSAPADGTGGASSRVGVDVRHLLHRDQATRHFLQLSDWTVHSAQWDPPLDEGEVLAAAAASVASGTAAQKGPRVSQKLRTAALTRLTQQLLRSEVSTAPSFRQSAWATAAAFHMARGRGELPALGACLAKRYTGDLQQGLAETLLEEDPARQLTPAHLADVLQGAIHHTSSLQGPGSAAAQGHDTPGRLAYASRVWFRTHAASLPTARIITFLHTASRVEAMRTKYARTAQGMCIAGVAALSLHAARRVLSHERPTGEADTPPPLLFTGWAMPGLLLATTRTLGLHGLVPMQIALQSPFNGVHAVRVDLLGQVVPSIAAALRSNMRSSGPANLGSALKQLGATLRRRAEWTRQGKPTVARCHLTLSSELCERAGEFGREPSDGVVGLCDLTGACAHDAVEAIRHYLLHTQGAASLELPALMNCADGMLALAVHAEAGSLSAAPGLSQAVQDVVEAAVRRCITLAPTSPLHFHAVHLLRAVHHWLEHSEPCVRTTLRQAVAEWVGLLEAATEAQPRLAALPLARKLNEALQSTP